MLLLEVRLVSATSVTRHSCHSRSGPPEPGQAARCQGSRAEEAAEQGAG